MREVTADFIAALRDGAPIALLAEIDHPAGMVRVWTGVGTLDYDGKEWVGVGFLGSIEGLTQNEGIKVENMTFELRGMPNEAYEWLMQSVKGRLATVWLAAFNEEGNIVPLPLVLAIARLDVQLYSVSDDGQAKVILQGQSGFFRLERSVDVSWSREEQIRTYPDDTGFDMIPTLVDKEVNWTRT